MLTLKLTRKGKTRFLNLDNYTQADFDTFEGTPTLDLFMGSDPEYFRLVGADALAALALLEDDAEVTRLTARPTIEPDRSDDWERLVGFKGRPGARPVEIEVVKPTIADPGAEAAWQEFIAIKPGPTSPAFRRPMFPVEVDVPIAAEIPGGDEAGYPEGDDRMARGFLLSFLRDRPADALHVVHAARSHGISASALAAGRRLLDGQIREECGVLSLVDPVRDAAAEVVAGFAQEADQVTHRHTCRDCFQVWTTSTAPDRVRDDCPFCGSLNSRKHVVPAAALAAGRAS